MKRLFNFKTAVIFAILSGMGVSLGYAQTWTPEPECFGFDCNGEPDWLEHAPDLGALDHEWMNYGSWRGITSRFHVDKRSLNICLNHCKWHADQADGICREGEPLNGQLICKDVWNKVYSECAATCTDVVHLN